MLVFLLESCTAYLMRLIKTRIWELMKMVKGKSKVRDIFFFWQSRLKFQSLTNKYLPKLVKNKGLVKELEQ